MKEHANKAGLEDVSVEFYNKKGTVRFDNLYNESYFRPRSLVSESNGGIENSTLNSSKLTDKENSISPIKGILSLLGIRHYSMGFWR